MKRLGIVLGALSLLFYAGCASLTHHKNEVALKKVKRIAIAGFSVRGPQPASLGVNSNFVPKQNDDVTKMYDVLGAAYARHMKWKVLPAEQMKNMAAYKTAYDDTMKGFQNKMPMGQGTQQYLVDGVMDNDSLRILGPKGRDALLKGLGVDAIVTAEVYVSLGGTLVMGIGNRYPQARASFWLYTAGAEAPDWFEGNLEGEPSKTSVGKTAFFEEKELYRLALESAKTAFAKLAAK